ncbi:MAG: PorP/SprF family type IX secretion system membrane protein [Bacteroidota bacterium]
MKKGFTIVLFVFICSFADAQQIGMYSHYFYKPLVYNPAFTGSNDAPNATIISRSQWTDFTNAPQLTVFTVDGNLMDKKVGVGLGLISDRKGITNRMGGHLYYSYRLKINDDTRLMFGLSAGVIDHTIDFSKALVENSLDPTLYNNSQHKTSFDASVGLAFTWKALEIGAAVPQIIGNKINYVDSSNVRAYYTQARHYMASLKYSFLISEEKGISIAPQALVRFVPQSPFQFDANVNLDWKDKFWIGATYKSDYAVAANVGFCLHKQLCVGYSYDFIIGPIGKYSGMTHEIMVNFKFGKSKTSEPAITDVKTDTAAVAVENPEYEDKLDDLEIQLKKNQAKLKELNDKLAKKQLAVSRSAKPGIQDSDGIFVTKRNDFKDSKNQMAEKGYYVMVGIFFYRDFANEEVKNFVKLGYKNTDWLFSASKQNNYVFTHKLDTKEEAFQKVKEVTASGGSNVWILKLID